MHQPFEGLSLEAIEARLSTRSIGRTSTPNEVWQTIDSTNTRAAELAKAGAPDGVFIAARQQTAGRGRLGRIWVSPPDAGVYLSVLLRPIQLSGANLSTITLASGVAVSRAVETVTGVRLGLKWVNDLVCDGRKIGGILAEMHGGGGETMSERALIIGFGLNVRMEPDAVPEDLRDKMGWLEALAKDRLDSNAITAQLLLELERVYDQLKAGQSAKILQEWRSRSVTLGQEIIASCGDTSLAGTAEDIDETGALLVKSSDGQIHHIHAGEVTIRTRQGKYI
jgi:BirA family biotin operon repressor/biotin-[acetyl-CoA-carboxylase] ligase